MNPSMPPHLKRPAPPVWLTSHLLAGGKDKRRTLRTRPGCVGWSSRRTGARLPRRHSASRVSFQRHPGRMSIERTACTENLVQFCHAHKVEFSLTLQEEAGFERMMLVEREAEACHDRDGGRTSRMSSER